MVRRLYRRNTDSHLPAILTGVVVLLVLTVLVPTARTVAPTSTRASHPLTFGSVPQSPSTGAGTAGGRGFGWDSFPIESGPRAASDSSYWSNITALGAIAPGATFGGALAFDPAANTTMFLGGDSLYSLGDSWTYNNYTWHNASGGVPDTFAALAYDDSDSELIAFGGQAQIAGNPGGGPTIPTNATYRFSGDSWVNLTSTLSVSPPPAASPMMASDPANHSAVLLDPVGTGNDSQTWSFANGTWTNLTATAGQPPPGPSEVDSVMAYDPADGAVIFFGGSFPGPNYEVATNETWEFLDGRWTDLNITGPDFITGTVQTMAFDSAANALVDLVAPPYLYSSNASPEYEDWEFSGGVWANQTSHLPATPPIGYDPLSEWDAADGYLFYMSGGYDSQSWDLGSTPLQAQLTVAPSPIDVGNTTTFTTVVTGGAPPLQYLYSGLPPGCVSSSAPVLTCQPAQPDNFTIQVSVTDYSNVTVNASAGLEVEPRLLASGPLVSPSIVYLGYPVNFSVAVTGGLPPYKFDWVVPILNCNPPDLAQFSCNAGQPGTYAISVTVTDGSPTGEAAASGDLTVVAYPAITSFTASPTRLEVGQVLNLNTSTAGGTPSFGYNYSQLPQGCQGLTGPSFSCRPTAPGTFNITLAVTDGLGTTLHATVEVTVLPALSIVGEEVSPNPATVGSVVTFNFTVSGGEGPFHSDWADLPPGCAPSQAAFNCTMTTSGSFEVELTVHDALDRGALANVTLTVAAGVGPSGAGSGIELVPLWAWAAVGLGALAGVGLVLWDRQRRGRSPSSDPGPPGGGIEEIAETGEPTPT